MIKYLNEFFLKHHQFFKKLCNIWLILHTVKFTKCILLHSAQVHVRSDNEINLREFINNLITFSIVIC